MNEFEELTLLVKHEFEKVFPDSKINISYGFDKESIYIRPFLAKDNTETANRIMENDIFHIMFNVEKHGEDFTLENNHKSYFINPENTYCVYGSRILKFRKVTGSMGKIADSMGKFFAQMKKSLQDDLTSGKIHKNHLDLVTKKLS